MARVGRDLKDHEAPTPLPQAEGPPTSSFNTIPGSPGPHPDGFWISPGKETLPTLLAACSSHLHGKEVLSCVRMGLPVFQVVPISPSECLCLRNLEVVLKGTFNSCLFTTSCKNLVTSVGCVWFEQMCIAPSCAWGLRNPHSNLTET